VSTRADTGEVRITRQNSDQGRDKLDIITIQLGHLDATLAMLSPSHEVNSHFSLPTTKTSSSRI
jgi:hypothetical protein